VPYRESPPRALAVSRRFAAEDSFRWLKLVLGPALLGMAVFFLWTGTWNTLECTGAACVLRQEHLLREDQQFPFDARHPPAVVVEAARVGKNGQGKRLVLRYPNGGDVELARDWGSGVEANATRLRAYLADPRGTFSLRQPHDLFWVGLMVFVACLGLLILLDGLTLLGWRRVGADGDRRIVTVDRVLFGLRVKRETFPITARTTVGRAQVNPDNPHFYWLTLEAPGAPPQRLPLLDRPKTRALVEELLATSPTNHS